MSDLKERPNAKHVSRACLECRGRHLKCDGKQPICTRCTNANRDCNYVKSKRGGSRKRGVTKIKVESNNALSSSSSSSLISKISPSNVDSLRNAIADVTSSSSSSSSSSIKTIDSNRTIIRSDLRKFLQSKNNNSLSENDLILPCVKAGHSHLSNNKNCTQSCMTLDNYGKPPPCLTNHQLDSNEDTNNHKNNNKKKSINFYPTFNSSKDKSALDKLFDPSLLKPISDYYISPILIKDLNINEIITTYYSSFHNIHPFLPDKENILNYLNSIPHNWDLLLCMKMIGDGQTSSIYSKDVELVNYMIGQIVDYIKQIGKDFVTLQSLLLLSMVSHISSLHDLSTFLRHALVDLTFELNLNNLDRDFIPQIFTDVNGFITETDKSNGNGNKIIITKDTNTTTTNKLNGNMHTPTSSIDSTSVINELYSTGTRVSSISKDILIDTARRTLWEIYFFDTLSGTASGHTTSKLASVKILTFFPKTVPRDIFDYKSRAESCKLVNDAIKLNVAIQSNKDVQSHLIHMRASIGNWDMRLENPDMYNYPYLVNASGIVNEGVQQASLLTNYAKIFVHRPFSYLWRPDVSKHPKCSDEAGVTDNCETLKTQEVDSRKIIETRKTIESASSVIRSLIDTNPSKILKRTPFFACALAFACLVHLGAYSWVDSSISFFDENKNLNLNSLRQNINNEELETYTEYIKLELSGIYAISQHWALSNKLITHIRDTLVKVAPKLYKSVQSSIPENIRLLPRKIQIDSNEIKKSRNQGTEITINNNNNNLRRNNEIKLNIDSNSNSINITSSSSSLNTPTTNSNNSYNNIMNNNNNSNMTLINTDSPSISPLTDSTSPFNNSQSMQLNVSNNTINASHNLNKNISINKSQSLFKSNSQLQHQQQQQQFQQDDQSQLQDQCNLQDDESQLQQDQQQFKQPSSFTTNELTIDGQVSNIKEEKLNLLNNTANINTNDTEKNNNTSNNNATVSRELTEIDFNDIFNNNNAALSPNSDTGCDWVDKHLFEFDGFDFPDNFDLNFNQNVNSTSN
ncbi:binding protein [[Candida] boidinii]|nr:binding protein [[Candida] boidinii]OWB64318.1 binding protein [[Candida] boidinii]